MPTAVAYGDRKASILEVLIAEARSKRTIRYGVLGAKIGIPARGPWKAVLDELGRDEVAAGRPDITYLVVNARTGLPGQIALEPAWHPSP